MSNKTNEPNELDAHSAGKIDTTIILQKAKAFNDVATAQIAPGFAKKATQHPFGTQRVDCTEQLGTINGFPNYIMFSLLQAQAREMSALDASLTNVLVEDCQAAGKVIDKMQTIQNYLETVLESSDTDRSYDSLPSLSIANLQKAGTDFSDPTNDLAIHGAIGEINALGMVQIRTPTTTSNEFMGCTGAIVSRYMVVTSAHCIHHLDTGGDKVGLFNGYIQYFDPDLPTGSTRLLAYPGENLTSFWIWPTYQGGTDTQSDLAVLTKWQPFPNVSTDDFLMLYRGSFGAFSSTYVYGRGYNSYAGTGAGTMRYENIPIEWYGEHHFYALAYGHRLCQGDSGGPWVWKTGMDKSVLVGVTSNVETNSNKRCAKLGGKERATRMTDDKATQITQLQAIIDPYSECRSKLIDGQFAYQCY
jgi:hypothetical protein